MDAELSTDSGARSLTAGESSWKTRTGGGSPRDRKNPRAKNNNHSVQSHALADLHCSDWSVTPGSRTWPSIQSQDSEWMNPVI